MRSWKFLASLLLLTLLPSLCPASGISYFITTDQSGQNVQLDIFHTNYWTFVPLVPFTFGGGMFEMRDGSQTGDPVFSMLTFLEGPPSTGTVLATIQYSASQFDAVHGGDSTSWAVVEYSVGPFDLQPGRLYTIMLTSDAPASGSRQYFIKSQASFEDENSQPLPNPPPIYYNSLAQMNATPEPSSWMLLGGCLVAMLYRRARRAS